MTDQLTVTYGIEYQTDNGMQLARFSDDSVATWDNRGEAEMVAASLEMAHIIPMTVVEVIKSSVLQ